MIPKNACVKDEKISVNIEKINKKKSKPKDKFTETVHSIEIQGELIEYTARAGTMVMKYEEDEKSPQPKAEIFYISYTKKDEDPATRPITS